MRSPHRRIRERREGWRGSSRPAQLSRPRSSAHVGSVTSVAAIGRRRREFVTVCAWWDEELREIYENEII